MPTTSNSYGTVAKTLHWLIAFAVIAMLIVGWTMTNIPRDNPYKFPLFQWHKSIGITILLLSLFRLFWRLTHKTPPLPDGMPGWEKFAAKSTHAVFYILIIGMPLLGWIMVSSSSMNLPTYLFTYIPWPHLPGFTDMDPESKKNIGHLASRAHNYAAYLLAGLLFLHVAAAHKHHWFDRDNVLTNMAPGPIARLLDRLRGMK